MSNRSFLGCLTAIALVVIAVIAIPVISFSNDHAYTVTITDKERVTTQVAEGQTDSKYLIYGEDENGKTYVFEDTDTLFRWKFNSSDVFGALKEGETYELTVIGFRVHIFNWYENIIDFKAVK
jgi:phi77 ORF031-like protein